MYRRPPGSTRHDPLVPYTAGFRSGRIGSGWTRSDAHPAQHGPYLLGAWPCAADFYLTMLMRWSRHMPRPATAWPHLDARAGRMRALPSFRELYAREGLAEWT